MTFTLGRLIRTCRFLTVDQIVGQMRVRIAGPVRYRTHNEPISLGTRRAPSPFLGPSDHILVGDDFLEMLNERHSIRPSPQWEESLRSPLWTYTLHYHDWLRSEELPSKKRQSILEDWLHHHGRGVGWDSGPTSQRILNWLKMLMTPSLFDETWNAEPLLRSLANQLETLSHSLEYHLSGNHYLWNLVALVAGGVALRGAGPDRWLAFEPLLIDELAVQIGREGAHYERSPMYHALLLEHLMDLLNLCQANPKRLSGGAQERLIDACLRMLSSHGVWTHPDGEIALFGDSAFRVSKNLSQLDAYRSNLGLSEPDAIQHRLAEAGFVRFEFGSFTLIMSVSGPAPSHQPGHAHCDALSFELSHGDTRMITDTGVFEYSDGPRRTLSRSVRAHATVEIPGEEPAEFWGAHRVGGRPEVRLVEYREGAAVEASVAPWTRSSLHHRRILRSAGGFRLEDQVRGYAGEAVARFPLAPGVDVQQTSDGCLLTRDEAKVHLTELDSGTMQVATAPYFSEFGLEVARKVLEISFRERWSVAFRSG